MAAGSVSAPLIFPIVPLSHRHKNHINTRTRVCLHSESRDVDLFFTVDGSKPDTRSRKYTEPILLPSGRVCVRATAKTSEGRESSTVTKVFTVDDVTAQSPEPANHSLPQSHVTSTNHSPPQLSTSCVEPTASCGKNPVPELRSKTKISPPSGPHFLRPDFRPEDSSFLKTLSSTEKNRIQRETDFLRCPECLCPRPSDPSARFCSFCGAQITAVPPAAPPAENSQLKSCRSCCALVPACSESCLICEAPVRPQLRPQSSLHLTAPVLCPFCRSLNPPHVSSCVYCEAALSAASGTESAPCGPDRTRTKRGHVIRRVTCLRCGASGPDSASFCLTCGLHLRAPPPQGPAANQAPASGPAPSVKAPPTAEQSTQTVGLYFPSATALRNNQDQRNQWNQRNQRPRSREALSAVSPGRGFWRQQLDHVCAHLRSHAQNHAPFRTLLGEPRLGRLVSAVVQEDPHEVTLTVSFSAPQNQSRDENQVLNQALNQALNQTCADRGAPAGGGAGLQSLSSVTEGAGLRRSTSRGQHGAPE